MPPRLSSTRGASGAAKSSTSAMGTSGAPCPPAATSRGRKPLTTRTPNCSARIAGSPSCQVTSGGSCQMVCPGNAMKAMSDVGHPRLVQQDLHRLGGPFRDPHVEPGERGRADRAGRIERAPELGSLLRGVGTGHEREQRRVGRALEPDQRRVHAVERRPRHEADRQCGPLAHVLRTGGGSPTMVRRRPS